MHISLVRKPAHRRLINELEGNNFHNTFNLINLARGMEIKKEKKNVK